MAKASSEVGDGRHRRWVAHRKQRQGRILDAALVVIGKSSDPAEVSVSQIAAEAGLPRTVVYRHFADRAALDRAIQEHIFSQLSDTLLPQFELTGTIEQIISRIVGAYVRWAAQHPQLHVLTHQPTAGGADEQPLNRAINLVAELIEMLVLGGTSALQVEITSQQRLRLKPLVFGIVGQVRATVQYWLGVEGERLSVEHLIRHISRSVWFQLSGTAADLGIVLPTDVPLDSLRAAVATVRS